MEEEKPKKKRKNNADEGRKERKANWKEYTATVEEIKAFLNDHVYLRYNVITRRVEDQMRFAEYLRKWLVAMVAGEAEAVDSGRCGQ